ncbi:MAG TPA: RNA polymerase sigma factor, partial [Enhygromyxa sp.]|nr:RNA polymerase sigma factor [Enhygromyxa sp.]
MSALDQDYDFSARVEDDDELESRWAEPGLEPGFERFYREHYAFVWRSARRMLAGAGDDRIEDVLQDTWMTAYRRFDSFAGECRPTTWLFGILRNIVRNHERGERRHNRRVAAFVEHERERERSRGADDTTRLLGPKLLEGFLRTLDEDKRAVFVLAELEGHSGREIAQALHINANTAQSRLRAARQQFCTYFDLPGSRSVRV